MPITVNEIKGLNTPLEDETILTRERLTQDVVSPLKPQQGVVSEEDNAFLSTLEREPDLKLKIGAPSVEEEPEDLNFLGSLDQGQPRAEIPDAGEFTVEDVQRGKAIAATLDMPFISVMENLQSLTELVEETDGNFFQKTGQSLMRGAGMVYILSGRAATLAGFDQIGKDQRDFGIQMAEAYARTLPPEEFTWGRLRDSDWWATSFMESVPLMISLFPAAVIGAYGAIAAGTVGAAALGQIGLGAGAKIILGAIGASSLSRPVESAFEAAGVYEEAIQQGKTDEEATRRADQTFFGNLNLAGLDAAQLALAFTPMRFMGAAANRSLMRRIATTTGKLGVVAVTEAGEEAYQAAITQVASGRQPGIIPALMNFDAEMQEGSALGMVMGGGVGTAGSVWTTFTNRLDDTMPENVRAVFDEAKASSLSMGVSDKRATMSAIDAIGETPEGAEFLKAQVERIIELTDPKRQNTSPTTVTVQQAEDQVTQVETEEFQASEQELLSDEMFDRIGQGQTTFAAEIGVEEAAPADPTERLEQAEQQDEGIDLVEQADPPAQIGLESQIGSPVGLAAQGVPEGQGFAPQAPGEPIRLEEAFVAPEPFRLVSDEAFEAAKFNLREKAKGLRIGVDPTVIPDLVTVGVGFMERGARSFAEFSTQMIRQFGNSIKRRLPELWEMTQNSFRKQQGAKLRPESDIGHKREITTGRYVGAPSQIGSSPQKLVALRKELHKLALEGQAGRHWYERSARAVLDFVQGDPVEAEKFVGLLAIYSQGTAVSANTTGAIKAWQQWKQGKPITAGRFPNQQQQRAKEWLEKGTDFGGIKVNNFYADLMTEIEVGKVDFNHSTMDMWMAIAFDYGSKVLDQGPKYRFAQREIQALAEQLGIPPHQVQASIWTAIKFRVENSAKDRAKFEEKAGIRLPTEGRGFEIPAEKEEAHFRAARKVGLASKVTQAEIDASVFDFADALQQRSAQVSWEATPGISTGVLPGIHRATLSQQIEYLTAMRFVLTDSKGRDLIDNQLGLLTTRGEEVLSGWNGRTTTSVQQQAGVVVVEGQVDELSRLGINLAADIRGMVLAQEAVAWHFPIFNSGVSGQNGVEFTIGRTLTEEESDALYQAVIKKLGHSFSPPIPSPEGIRFLNFPNEKIALAGETDPQKRRELQRQLKKLNQDFFEAITDVVGEQVLEVSDVKRFETDGELRENNWQTGDKEYRDRIREAAPRYGKGRWPKGFNLLNWVDNVIGPQVAAVNQRFAKKYGWDKPDPPKAFVKQSTFEASEKEFREGARGFRAGLDPTLLKPLIIIGAYHIERGIRSFGAWSKRMIADHGTGIAKHLREIWEKSNLMVRKEPGVARPPKRVSQVDIKKRTGQVSLADLVREDVALRAALKKAEQASRIAFRAGDKAAQERVKIEMRDLLIKAKVRAEAFGFNEGFTVAEKLTRQELQQAFKESRAEIQETQKAIVDLVNEQLPPDLRGKFLGPIIQRLTSRRQESILQRIQQLSEARSNEELTEEIASLKQYPKSLAVEYKKRIDDLLGDINTRKITPATRQKLENLKELAEEFGMPSGVSANILKQMQRLENRQASDMTEDELRSLVDIGKRLTEMGRVKAKMKFRYDKEALDAAKEKLLAGTNNLDFEVTGEPGTQDKLKAAAKTMYFNTLTPRRTAEAIDGYVTDGVNSRLVTEMAKQETEAQWTVRTLLESAVNQMMDVGVQSLTDEQNIRIMINIREQEGATEAVKTLMEQYGFDEVPVLTQQEQGVINIIRQTMNEFTDQIAATYEELTNTPFVRLPSYIMPLKYEGEVVSNPTETILHDRYRTTQTFQGMMIQRKNPGKKQPRVDVFGIFEQGINEQQWYLQMQPLLNNTAQLVKSKEYLAKAGTIATNWWKDHIDIMANRGWSASATHDAFAQGMKIARQNLAQAILGYKLSSIMMQPFAIIDAMAYVQARWGAAAAAQIFAEFAAAWAIPGRAKAFIEADESHKLILRKGGEVAIAETLEKVGRSERKIDKFIRGGMSMLQRADVRTAAGVQAGIQKILEKNNIPDAAREAGLLMDMTSSSSDISHRPHVLAKGEGARAWFTFQTFMLNRWGIVWHDLILKGLVKGPTYKARFDALLGLMIIVAGKIAEDEAREFMFEKTTGRQLPDQSMLIQALWAIPSNIPFFGNMIDIRSGRGGSEIPLVRVLQDLMGFPKIVTGKKPSTKIRAALRSLEAALTIRFGLPFTAQGFDLLERLLVPPEAPSRRSTR